MPSAILRLNLPSSTDNVDEANGIVRACRLAEVGKLATFSDLQGKPKSVRMTPKVIAGLLALFSAGNVAPAHWTHSWIENGEDALNTRVAKFENFRTDDAGNLVADANLWPTEHKAAILHAAKHDPTGMMISTVFDYKGGTEDAEVVSVRAADFVAQGAATTALLAKLSETKTNTAIMADETDIMATLTEAFKDKHKRAAFKALMKSVEKDDEGEMEPEVATMRAAVGITDADVKPEDKNLGVNVALLAQASRAIARQIAALNAAKDDIVNTAKLAAETEATKAATKVLGKGGFIQSTGAHPEGDTYTATLAKFTAVEDNPVKAAAMMLRKHPELADAHAHATRVRAAAVKPFNG